MENNLEIYEKVADEYQDFSLNAAEITLINKFKNNWHKTSMLDIGIGTGRTTIIFSAIAKEYIGIDYSPNMINKCRQHMPRSLSVNLAVCDARDLSGYYDRGIDFILFSMNGIDSVGFDDRVKILQEVRKTLHNAGYFCFSTHLLSSFSIDLSLPTINYKRLPQTSYRFYKNLKRYLKLRYLYRNESTHEIRKQDWKVLITGDHDFRMQIFHINYDFQLDQLKDAGFQVEMVIDENGNQFDPARSRDMKWVYFLCKPAN
jgi:ubiquinone/menaquinone biosynthesis C-methylase UbiE